MKVGIITLGIALVVVVSIAFMSVVTIDAGHRGVLLTYGKVEDVILGEGITMITPFVNSVAEMSVQTQAQLAVSSAASKDLQDVTTEVTLNFKLDPLKINRIYQNLGVSYQEIVIQPAIQESVKAATAQYTAEELITERANVKERIENLLRERLSAYGILIETVSITEFRFSEEFTHAIEAKVTATQQALKAENDLRRIEIEAKQAVTQAQAQADSTLAKAKAEAEAIRITGSALKENPQLVQLEIAKKWNGVLPLNLYGNAPIPFLNIQQPTWQEQLAWEKTEKI